jgi:hypothetical protein
MQTITSRINRLLLAGVNAAAGVARPIMNRVAMAQARDILLERQRRALASTVDLVQRRMSHVKPASSKFDLLTSAFGQADTSGGRLICEFGVFTGATVNHIASLTPNTVFGFDSFEGLPEGWSGRLGKGHFAVNKLPEVRQNVVLIKGWFNETLPTFLAQNNGMAGFIHIDCDLYSSTKTVFDLLTPRLGPGTVIVFDEYFNYPEWEQGEHKAFGEFLSQTGMSCEFIGYHRKDEQVAAVLRNKVSG